MKITLKNVILASLIVFNLVIIFSNFTSYEGLEGKTQDTEEINKSEEDEEKNKPEADLELPTEPTKSDVKYGIVGEGEMSSS